MSALPGELEEGALVKEVDILPSGMLCMYNVFVHLMSAFIVCTCKCIHS